MGGFANSVVNDLVPMLLDPLNVTGTQGGGGAAPLPAQPTNTQPQVSDKPSGFMASLGAGPAGDRINAFRAPLGVHIQPPPPSQWTYEPGKGPAWSTAERQGTTNNFTMTPNLPGSAGYNAHKGNRF